VEGLFEVIKLMSIEFFDKFSLNMTSFFTLPGLTIAAYFNNYHDPDHQIKMIKGQVEKDIRSAYHGGVINVYNTQEVKDSFYYDMNSQYPNAMLNDMPVGNPIFTNDNNLDDIFGFVYGKITPPTKEILPNLTIETTVNGEIVFLRESFYRAVNKLKLELKKVIHLKCYVVINLNEEKMYSNILFKNYIILNDLAKMM